MADYGKAGVAADLEYNKNKNAKVKAKSERSKQVTRQHDYNDLALMHHQASADRLVQTPDIMVIQTAQKRDRDPHNFVKVEENSHEIISDLSAEIKKYESEKSEEVLSSFNSDDGGAARIQEVTKYALSKEFIK